MITPLDIENKKFSKQMMNGYNVDEVDDFLDEIMEDYESNYKELATLRPKIEELEYALERYKNIENTLQNTLVMAQSTADEVKNVAKQQADQIVGDAQREAENIIRNSKENALKAVDELEHQIRIKEQQYNEARKQFDIYKAKMEALLISQSELIKEMNKEEEKQKAKRDRRFFLHVKKISGPFLPWLPILQYYRNIKYILQFY